MPRRLRVHLAGAFYHVTLRGNHQQVIFASEGDRRLLDVIVVRALEKFDTRLHAYCWMTNHLHFLLQAGPSPLGNPMRNIASEFARAMQAKMATTGHLFERRYHASLVSADSYLLELIRYIHLNPVRAGICKDPSEFPWSSHHRYLGTREEPWVETRFVLRLLGSTQAKARVAYREFLSCGNSDWEPALQLAEVENSGPAALVGPGPISRPASSAAGDLSALIAEACARFDVAPARIQSKRNDPFMTKVRGWIAYQARKREVASFAAVARALGRDEATLRYAMRAYPEQMD